MNSVKQQRLSQLDVFRALAILGVLHVHATSFAAGEQALQSPYYLWINGINIFFKFGTPSFIFLSSFVLFYNYYGRPLTRSLVTHFYLRRLTYILLPYLLVSAGYYVVVALGTGQLSGMAVVSHLTSFGRKLLTGSAYAHLYFVFISIQFYILFPFLLFLLKRFKGLVKWAIPVGLALQWGFILWNKYELHIVEKGSLAISYFAYYMMGAFVAVYFDSIKDWLQTPWKAMSGRRRAVLAVWFAAWLAAAFIHVQLWYAGRRAGVWVNSLWYELAWNVHTMLSAWVLLYFAFWLYRAAPAWLTAVLIRLGELSFAVYLIHPLVLLVYRRFRYHIAPESFTYLLFLLGGFAAALAVSWAVVQFAFRRIPLAWMAFGSMPRSLQTERDRKDGAAGPGAGTTGSVRNL